jgi:type II secretory pathway pseudopilin PulG
MRDDVTENPGFLRRRPRFRGEAGFTLIEAVFAMVLFAGLAAAMAGLLTSAVSANKLARQRTLADQAALEHIEMIRRLDYDDVGIVLGNPPGTVAATTPINLTGLDATITTQIRYVDDPTPTSYETTANYKRVMVSVRRDDDSRLLAREVTYVAPTSRTPFGGVNLAIVQPLVIDYALNVPVENVTVSLLTGPSAPRTDVTDVTGTVSFKKLTPNPTATCPADCYDLTASLSGYLQLNSPTRLNVGPGQTASPTIQIYRPATINVVVQNSGGTPFAGTATVKLTSARNGATQTYSVSGGSGAITTLAGESIVPSVQYTAEAWTTGGTPLCASPVTQYVPDDYPTVLSSTMVLTLGACPSGGVNVTVNWGASPAPGATVTLSGGPYSMSPVSGATDSSGLVSFSGVPSGAGYTVTATKSGQSATPQTISVATGSATNVTMNLPTGSLLVQVRWAGLNVNGASVQVTGGPNSVNVTQTTPASGNVTFTNLPAGSGYTVTATRSGENASTTATVPAGSTGTVTLNLPTATLTVNVKRGSTNQNGATVNLSLGPMGINVTGTTNSSGNVTFTNVPVGTGYTLKAWRCAAASPQRSRSVTGQTVNAPSTSINLVFSTNTCPLP